MSLKTKLYDAFGELLYVLAMADGVIQPEEIAVLEAIVDKHPFGKDIKWSFEYEELHHSNVEDLYQKVLNMCQIIGPDPEYQNMIDMMKEIAHASSGVDSNEQKVIDRFTHELTERFQDDLSKLDD